MIIYETVTINGQQFEHVYSDANRQVCRDGQTWISDIDYNVFEPGVAGWSVIA